MDFFRSLSMKKISLVLFVLALLGVIVSEQLDWEMIYVVCKPMVMISLIIHYYVSLRSHERSTMAIVAMLLSLAGDVLLMKPEYFIPGLIAFLLAHVAYILVYRQHRLAESTNELQGIQRIRLAFPIVLAGTGLVVVLYPRLGDLTIPVMVYALVITVMALTALFRYGRTTSQSFWLVFFGAVLFMISDSVLAVNKFLSPVNLAGLWIMLTYGVAQFLIIRGLMKHPQEV